MDHQESIPARGAFLFLSIDMVNSTAYKELEERWPFVIHRFYLSASEEIRSICPRFQTWKYIGDEVVFWRHVRAEDDLPALVAGVHGACERIRSALDRLGEQYPIRTRNVIGAKATMWIAAVEYVRNDETLTRTDTNGINNRLIREHHISTFGRDGGVGEAKNLVDFIGPEIDIGFRISKFAHNRFLLVSASLGYLLLRNDPDGTGMAARARVVGFEKLKGVWRERPYPIIWYCPDWDNAPRLFQYDEPFDAAWIARICDGNTRPLSLLEKVLDDTNHLDRATTVAKLIADTGAASGV